MKLITTLCLLAALLQGAASHSADPDRTQIESEVMTVLDEFMRTFNASDPVAHVGSGREHKWPPVRAVASRSRMGHRTVPTAERTSLLPRPRRRPSSATRRHLLTWRGWRSSKAQAPPRPGRPRPRAVARFGLPDCLM